MPTYWSIAYVAIWLSMLKKLEILALNGNRITGSIPGWLSTLPRLKSLQLSHNLISGEFPKELCALPTLVSAQVYQRDNDSLLLPIYYLENNEVRQYSSLSYFYPRLSLDNNSLSGSIPIEIGRLKLLRALHLGHNSFTGNIPDQISELTNLEELDLSANQLSGEIPASLARLHFLATFSVANNNLHGRIPSGTQLQGFDTSAYEGNLRLCGAPLPRCDHITNGNEDKDIQNEKDGRTTPWFHITAMFGFITGFWAVCGPLALNRNWRDSYFRYLNNLKDQLYGAFAVSLARRR
ncbi:receptor-like protein 2 [Juglans microcarpa x Juglans regia]|uniref:receptor-like protein 2 n=1 Tax=Juglans microcarpa x Juglans regia TaxID=2249226 RepID=UPI001B7F38CC|nr:receptor-like protein 2 [Juglans microcarpa x Juglans regia]